MLGRTAQDSHLNSHTAPELCDLLRGPMLVYMGSFSYMPSAGLRVEFLLHTPCRLLSLGSFSHKVYAGLFM